MFLNIYFYYASCVNYPTSVCIKKSLYFGKRLIIYMCQIYRNANWTYSNQPDVRHCLLYVYYVFCVGFGEIKKTDKIEII